MLRGIPLLHCFTYRDRHIALDVESGALHELDGIAFEIARVWQDKGRDAVLETLSGRFDAAEIREVLDEFDALHDVGEFDSPAPAILPFAGEPAIKAICLHVAHDCNLRCAYCFAGTGEYGADRALMPLDVGQKALDFLIEHSGDRTHLEVDFFGGEPLMNFRVVKDLVAYGRALEKTHGKTIAFTMTTNCLAVNDEVVDFCRDEIHNVVLSLDGRKAVHDAARKTVNGRPSYDLVLPGAQKLGLSRQEEEREYYVRATFTRQNLDFSQDFLALSEAGFEQISIEPVVLTGGDLALRETDLPAIFAEYDALAQIVEEREAEGKWTNFFHFMLYLDDGPCLSKRVSGCGAGNEYVAITPSGDIYPCHQFAGQSDFRMGNVMTGDFDETMRARFRANTLAAKPDCSGCWAKYHCSGGCAANAFSLNGDIRKPYRLACDMQKKRLECALGLFVARNAD